MSSTSEPTFTWRKGEKGRASVNRWVMIMRKFKFAFYAIVDVYAIVDD